MNPDASLLFQPFRLGDLDLPNRIVMAPLTRNRATPGTEAPNELAATYYRQRAGAGLIVSEASQISQQGQGYIWTPGLYSEAQIAAMDTKEFGEKQADILAAYREGRIAAADIKPALGRSGRWLKRRRQSFQRLDMVGARH